MTQTPPTKDAEVPITHASLTSKAIIHRVWRDYLTAFRGYLSLAIMCAIGVVITTQFLIWCLKPGVELLFGEGGSPAASDVPAFVSANPLLWVPVIMIVATLFRLVSQLGLATSVNRVGHSLVGRLQSQLFSGFVRSDLSQLDKAHSGSYLSSVLFDAGLMREATTNGVINYVQHTGIVIAMLVTMAVIDWRMTLGVLVAGPLIGAVLSKYNKRTKKAAKGAMEETSSLSTAIMESLDGIRVVKINNRETFEQDRVDAVISRRQGHIIKGANARASAAPTTEALTTIVLALVVTYAGWRAQAGAMTLGGFTGYIAALGAAGQSLRQLANLQTVMAEGFTAARRLFGVLDVRPQITDASETVELPRDFGLVRFDGVGFSYGDKPVLNDISFEARPGQAIALVGPSGSGKSSLLNLIPRFYEAQSGHIHFGAFNQKDLSIKSLRDNIALVSQDAFLFDDTLRANIAYARPDASEAEIRQAIADAAADEFINALPQGLETRTGEGGSRLSGGQKQRISIARAFLKNAPLLLLDEATSALDTQSEQKVQAALERLMAGRTTFIIAHRLSTVRHADLILVMDNGRIVERGTHDELMRRFGLYASLAGTQLLPETVA